MLRMDIQLMVRDLPPDHHQPIARRAGHPASEADRQFFGLNSKTPPKNRIQKIREIDRLYLCLQILNGKCVQ